MHDRKTSNEQLIISTVEIAKEAGEAITEIYSSDFNFEIKEDFTPLTQADKISNKIITKSLQKLTPKIPIISEEDCNIPFKVRSKWDQYWLIDPLDGTKEFISRNGEFTVNIALMKRNIPILGLIHIPIQDETYWGSNETGSFHLIGADKIKPIKVSKNHKGNLRILTSRSHPSKELSLAIERIENIVDYELIKMGSSIKFCLIASGVADLYPRLGPTMEWDTAAGQAIVEFAGGKMVTTDLHPMKYNQKVNFLNKKFIVSSNEIKKSDPILKALIEN